jgi:hypothetical protein
MGYSSEAYAAYGYDLGECEELWHEPWFEQGMETLGDEGEVVFGRLRELGADIEKLGYLSYGNMLSGPMGLVLSAVSYSADLKGGCTVIDTRIQDDGAVHARLRRAAELLGLKPETLAAGPQWFLAAWYG